MITEREEQLLASYEANIRAVIRQRDINAQEVDRLRVRVNDLETAIERLYLAYHRLIGAQEADSGATVEQIEELAARWDRTLNEVLDVFAGRPWMTRAEASPLIATKAIDQAISNLQVLSNLTDDPHMAEIIYTTADLLFAAIKVDTHSV